MSSANLLDEIKLEIGCRGHFLVHFLRAIGKVKSLEILS